MRRLFSVFNVTTSALYGGGLFGMHIALLIAVVLYIPSRLVTVPFRAGVLIASLLAINYAVNQRFAFYRGKLWVALIIFWGFYGLSIVMEPANYLQQSRMSYALYAFGICAIPMFAFIVLTNRSNLRMAMLCLCCSAFIAGIFSIALYGNASLGSSGRVKEGEMLGDFVAIGPLLLSYAGSAIFILGGYFALVRVSLRSLILRYGVAVILGLIGAYLMALGASRGPVIAVIVPFLVFMVCRIKKASDLILFFMSMVVLAVGGWALLFFADKMGSSLVRRLESLMYIQQTYMHTNVGVGRIEIYKATIEQFWGNPVLGNGLHCYAAQSYPHNFILEAYLTTGIIGGSAFLIYLFSCLSRAIKIIRYFPQYSWVSLFFLHYAVYCQLSSGIIANHYFWYSSSMVIAVYEFASREARGGGMRSNPIQSR